MKHSFKFEGKSVPAPEDQVGRQTVVMEIFEVENRDEVVAKFFEFMHSVGFRFPDDYSAFPEMDY